MPTKQNTEELRKINVKLVKITQKVTACYVNDRNVRSMFNLLLNNLIQHQKKSTIVHIFCK